MTVAYDVLVGVDWATQAHQVCLLSPEGEIEAERSVDHDARSIPGFIEALLRRTDGRAGRVAVVIEIPCGGLVETVLERGLHVYTLTPKQVDRFRDRHSVAGAKDDRRDAYVLAAALRTDLHKVRRVALDHPWGFRSGRSLVPTKTFARRSTASRIGSGSSGTAWRRTSCRSLRRPMSRGSGSSPGEGWTDRRRDGPEFKRRNSFDVTRSGA